MTAFSKFIIYSVISSFEMSLPKYFSDNSDIVPSSCISSIALFTAFIISGSTSFDQINEKGEYDFKLIGDPILIDKNAFPFAKDNTVIGNAS